MENDEVPAKVEMISTREMLTIAAMHPVSQKYEIVLACAHCRQPFQGFNAQGDVVFRIACACRELHGRVN